jgi:hypothetical protein
MRTVLLEGDRRGNVELMAIARGILHVYKGCSIGEVCYVIKLK